MQDFAERELGDKFPELLRVVYSYNGKFDCGMLKNLSFIEDEINSAWQSRYNKSFDLEEEPIISEAKMSKPINGLEKTNDQIKKEENDRLIEYAYYEKHRGDPFT